MKKEIKKRLSMKDNRPKWVIYFDVGVWIITLCLVFFFLFQYGLNFTQINIYQENPSCTMEKIGGGKILNLKTDEFIKENNFQIIEISDDNKTINLKPQW